MRLQPGMVVRELTGAALRMLFCSTQGAAQSVVLETASLDATGRISGSSITTAQYVGWRIQIDAALDVDHTGGHLLSEPNSPGDTGLFGMLSAAWPRGKSPLEIAHRWANSFGFGNKEHKP